MQEVPAASEAKCLHQRSSRRTVESLGATLGEQVFQLAKVCGGGQGSWCPPRLQWLIVAFLPAADWELLAAIEDMVVDGGGHEGAELEAKLLEQ